MSHDKTVKAFILVPEEDLESNKLPLKPSDIGTYDVFHCKESELKAKTNEILKSYENTPGQKFFVFELTVIKCFVVPLSQVEEMSIAKATEQE